MSVIKTNFNYIK